MYYLERDNCIEVTYHQLSVLIIEFRGLLPDVKTSYQNWPWLRYFVQWALTQNRDGRGVEHHAWTSHSPPITWRCSDRWSRDGVRSLITWRYSARWSRDGVSSLITWRYSDRGQEEVGGGAFGGPARAGAAAAAQAADHRAVLALRHLAPTGRARKENGRGRVVRDRRLARDRVFCSKTTPT